MVPKILTRRRAGQSKSAAADQGRTLAGTVGEWASGREFSAHDRGKHRLERGGWRRRRRDRDAEDLLASIDSPNRCDTG
jgi:hypothetical protein